MTGAIYNLVNEPKGEAYRQLIDSALNYCDSFQFVIRPSLAINDSCRGLINSLLRFLISRTNESAWPGTQLLEGTAEIYRFKLSSETAAILAQSADSLYSWLQPNLPEDLCFIKSKEKPWLVTITHERDCYLDLSENEKETLMKRIPALVLKKNKTYQ